MSDDFWGTCYGCGTYMSESDVSRWWKERFNDLTVLHGLCFDCEPITTIPSTGLGD